MANKSKSRTITSPLIVSEPLSSYVKMSGADSAGRFNILSQMEHLQSKYMGTGHADTTKFEWATHQHRWETSEREKNRMRASFPGTPLPV